MQFCDFFVSKALKQVIIDHAHSLHKGITDSRANEVETPPLEILAHGVGFGCSSGHFRCRASMILQRYAANKPPNVFVKRAKLRLHGEKRSGILNRGSYLKPVAHDAFIGE